MIKFKINDIEMKKPEEIYGYKVYRDELRFKRCPICGNSGHNHDFSINFVKGVFYCHRENKAGHINELKKYGFDITKIPEIINNLKNIPKYQKGSENLTKPTEKDFSDLFIKKKDKPNSSWLEYLSERCISEKTFKDVIAFDKYNNMMIPISNGEKIVGIRYRSMDKNFRSEKESSSSYFINWQNIKKFNYIIIVEGEIDLLSGLEVGANVVSLPFGAGNIKCVKNQKEWLSKFKYIIIATDNDKEGKRSKVKIINELKDLKSILLEVNLGEYKDFNEVLTSERKKAKLCYIINHSTKININ